MSQDARLAPQFAEVTAPKVTQRPAPKGGLLGRLSVGQKLALAGLLVGVPFAASLGKLVLDRQAQVQHLQLQLKGQTLIAPLQNAMQNTQLLRLSSTRLLQGDQSAQAALDEQRQKLKVALDTMHQQAKENGFTSVTEAVQKAQQAFDALSFSVDNAAMSAPEAQAAYTAVLKNNIIPMFDEVATSSNLKINSDNRVGDLVNGITTTFPQNLPNAGAIISGVTPTLVKLGAPGSVIDPGSRQAVRQQWESSKESLDVIQAQLARFMNTSPEMKASLSQGAESISKSGAAIFDGLQDGVITPARLGFTAAQIKELTPAYATALFSTFEKTNVVLGQQLKVAADQAQREALLLALLAVLGTLLLGTLLYFITRSITRPLSELTDASQRLSRGELNLNVPVTTSDEVGVLAQSFNTAAAQLRENALRVEQERLEAQQLQDNVGQFLDVTMDIADGDLTKRGKVTEDVLGNVVDSINLMVEELGETLRGVQRASQSVTSGSVAMLSSTAQIEQGATTTTEETLRVARQAQDVNVNIQEMARLAEESAQTARQALSASQEGQQAVQDTLQGMQQIRGSSEAVASGVQVLSDRSEQIQEIVDSISHIASQTNLLSLHASIEAAGAGEAGSRFAVVAEEVRQLADESHAAAARIAALIGQVQSEIKELSATMQVGAQNVEQGFKVAEQAGEKLRQIGTLSEASAQLAQTMSQAAVEQVRGVENMGQGVQQIAQIAEASQQSVKQGRSAAEQLQQLAHQLNSSLARFRLPSS